MASLMDRVERRVKERTGGKLEGRKDRRKRGKTVDVKAQWYAERDKGERKREWKEERNKENDDLINSPTHLCINTTRMQIRNIKQ